MHVHLVLNILDAKPRTLRQDWKAPRRRRPCRYLKACLLLARVEIHFAWKWGCAKQV